MKETDKRLPIANSAQTVFSQGCGRLTCDEEKVFMF